MLEEAELITYTVIGATIVLFVLAFLYTRYEKFTEIIICSLIGSYMIFSTATWLYSAYYHLIM